MSDINDPLLEELRRLAAAGSAAAADRELGRLLMDDAAPQLWRVIRAQMPDLPAADQEEVHGDALLRLTILLQRFAAGDEEIRIENFRAYVGATAANACRALLRSRHPERTRLQNQLRYALRHDAALAVWEGSDGLARCGLASWQGRELPPVEPAEGAGEFIVARGAKGEEPALPVLLRRYFLWRGRPIPFAELTAAMAQALGVRDLPPLPLGGADDPEDGAETASAPELVEERPGADRELEDRQFLSRLWAEVRELPRGQRVALLLNLRDTQGRDRLRLFPVTGVASLPELSRSLELPLAELRGLWERLPLDDRAISGLLAVTPRQVINLRKSARARLGRRLAAMLRSDYASNPPLREAPR